MQIASYRFKLTDNDLDTLRSLLLVAQQHHLERAIELRATNGPGTHQVIKHARQQAQAAQQLWALFVGVQRIRCYGIVPTGTLDRQQIARFLSAAGVSIPEPPAATPPE